MDVLVLIDKLDDLVHNAKPVPLTDQVRVDKEEIYDILDQMRATIPEEIKQARWIVKERQEMLAEAKREAERIVKEARERQERLISEEEITKQAERAAEDIIEDARGREREIRLGAEDYADEILNTLEVNLSKFIAAVQRGRDRLAGKDEPAEVSYASAPARCEVGGRRGELNGSRRASVPAEHWLDGGGRPDPRATRVQADRDAPKLGGDLGGIIRRATASPCPADALGARSLARGLRTGVAVLDGRGGPIEAEAVRVTARQRPGADRLRRPRRERPAFAASALAACERERDAQRHHGDPAAGAHRAQAARRASQPLAGGARGQRPGAVGQHRDHAADRRERGQLKRGVTAGGLDELRQHGGEDEQPLGVGGADHEALAQDPSQAARLDLQRRPARRRGARGRGSSGCPG